ncbi:hypothetical protein GCM10025787_51410 [Saccharopolyspora rosea]
MGAALSNDPDIEDVSITRARSRDGDVRFRPTCRAIRRTSAQSGRSRDPIPAEQHSASSSHALPNVEHDKTHGTVARGHRRATTDPPRLPV